MEKYTSLDFKPVIDAIDKSSDKEILAIGKLGSLLSNFVKNGSDISTSPVSVKEQINVHVKSKVFDPLNAVVERSIKQESAPSIDQNEEGSSASEIETPYSKTNGDNVDAKPLGSAGEKNKVELSPLDTEVEPSNANIGNSNANELTPSIEQNLEGNPISSAELLPSNTSVGDTLTNNDHSQHESSDFSDISEQTSNVTNNDNGVYQETTSSSPEQKAQLDEGCETN